MWNSLEGQLYREFEFKNFVEAFAFVTKVALLSERVNHHPEIRISYNVVEIFLSTHDEEDTITEKDRHMAEKIDMVFKSTILT